MCAKCDDSDSVSCFVSEDPIDGECPLKCHESAICSGETCPLGEFCSFTSDTVCRACDNCKYYKSNYAGITWSEGYSCDQTCSARHIAALMECPNGCTPAPSTATDEEDIFALDFVPGTSPATARSAAHAIEGFIFIFLSCCAV